MRPVSVSDHGTPPGWKAWARRIASITRLFLVVAVVSAGLLVLQTARAVQAMRQEQALIRSTERWESLASRLHSETPEEAQGGELRAIKYETDVAHALLDLRRVLDAAGVEDYRVALVGSSDEGSHPARYGEAAITTGLEHRRLIADEPAGGEGALSILDWREPLDLPEELEEWRLALELQAGFARLLSFLIGMENAPGIWSAPRARIRSTDDGLKAEMILRTFALKLDEAASRGGRLVDTRPGPVAAEDAEPGSVKPEGMRPGPAAPEEIRPGSDRPDAALSGDAPLRDPFHAGALRPRTAGSAGADELPSPPVPGAIRWGPDPSAWIEGRTVRPGERVGDWQLVEILRDAAVLRHRSGHVARVKAGS